MAKKKTSEAKKTETKDPEAKKAADQAKPKAPELLSKNTKISAKAGNTSKKVNTIHGKIIPVEVSAETAKIIQGFRN